MATLKKQEEQQIDKDLLDSIDNLNKEENTGETCGDGYFEDDFFEDNEECEETAEEAWQGLKKQLEITDDEETDETDKETNEETCEQTYDDAIEELFQEIEKDYTQCEEDEETAEETDEDIDENYKNCYDCINKDCEFNLHGKKWIPDMDLPLFIGGLLADEIMSNACRNMLHIIEIKDALFSIEDEEIREEALDRVKMVKENLCNTIEMIHKAPDKVYEIV